MAEEKDRLIFEIELKEKDTKKRVKELKSEIAGLKQEAKDLGTLNKNGVINNEKYAESLSEIEEKTKKLNEELKKNNRVLELQQKANDENIGYINQLRARLSLLTVQWAGLSEEELKNAKTGGVLSAEMKKISDELKELEKGVGDTRRNVGNYEEAIKSALGEHENFFNKVSSAIDVLKDFRDKWKEQAAGIKEYRANMLAQVSTIRETVKGMTAAQAASVAAGKGTQFLGLALKGLGIGLIIAALAGLVAFFTKSQDGADYLARKTAALGGAFTSLLNRLAPIGKVLVKVFTDPKQGLTDLIKLIGENLLNRLKAFQVIASGIVNLDWGKAADGLAQMATGATNLVTETQKAAAQAEELTKKAQGLREEERKIEVQRAKNRAEIEKQKLIAEDTTKSLKEREAAAKKAFSIENGLLKQQEAVQRRVIDNIKAEAKANQVGGSISVEYRDKIAEAEIKLAEIQEDSLGKQTELNNSLNSIRQEAADKAKEAAEKIAEAEQKELDLLAKKIALRAEIAKLQGKDSTNLEVEAIRAAARAEANQYKENQEAKQLIIQKGESEITKLLVEKEAERMTLQSETRKAGIEAQLALVEEGTAKELTLRQKLIKEESELSRVQAKAQITDKVRLSAELTRIDALEKKALADAEKAFYDKQLALVEEVNERRARLSKQLTDRIKTDLEKRNRDSLAATEAALVGAKAGSKKELDLQIAAIKKRAVMELANEQLTANERLAIQKRANKEIEELQKGYIVNVANQIVQIGEQVNGALSAIGDAQNKVQLSNLDKQQKAALSSAGLNADMREKIEKDFAGKREKIEKEGAEKRRKIALAESYVNEAKAIINILATAANPILAGFLVAAAHITAAQNRAIIQTQEFALGGVPGYQSDRRGAFIRGAGSGTSDSIPARISNGESVINAKSTSMFYPLLSAINQAGGGRAFPDAPQISPSTAFYAGGVAGGGQGGEISVAAIKTAMVEAFREMPVPVVDVVEVSRKTGKVTARELRNDT